MKKRYILRSLVTDRYFTWYDTDNKGWTTDRKQARLLCKYELRDWRRQMKEEIDEPIEVSEIWVKNVTSILDV